MSKDSMRHVISATVQNVPGVLAHISGMLASRGYNIDSLAVGETEDPNLSRMTFVVMGDDRILEQVGKQLEKIVTVVQVKNISSSDYVERDLMLIKVAAKPGPQRSEIRELTDIFRGRIVDVSSENVLIEISGKENKIEAFIDAMRDYGIVELVRTGRIAMTRGTGNVIQQKDGHGENDRLEPASIFRDIFDRLVRSGPTHISENLPSNKQELKWLQPFTTTTTLTFLS